MFSDYTIDQIGRIQVLHSAMLGAILALCWMILRSKRRDK